MLSCISCGFDCAIRLPECQFPLRSFFTLLNCKQGTSFNLKNCFSSFAIKQRHWSSFHNICALSLQQVHFLRVQKSRSLWKAGRSGRGMKLLWPSLVSWVLGTASSVCRIRDCSADRGNSKPPMERLSDGSPLGRWQLRNIASTQALLFCPDSWETCLAAHSCSLPYTAISS